VIVRAPEDLPPDLALPVVLRPAFTLGGHGGGLARTPGELERLLERALEESPVRQVLVEESLERWDEFELEVVRDANDNVVVVCSIENLDPMGVHTGDSVTVAPQMTLSDEAYQELRDAAAAVIRAVGVECGGSNIQFARERETGELRVIEMNPRVSRSSALASKATGYPFTEAFLKAMRSRELDAGCVTPWATLYDRPEGLHPWFRAELDRLDEALCSIGHVDDLVADDWLRLKRLGISDADVSVRCSVSEE